MKKWSPPKQRQLWGETQILPGDNWGQIFFDLFYVGGAYNLGNLIKTSELDSRCLLCFFATGFPSFMMWYDKLCFDARFTTRPGQDVFHRVIEILQLCCVATALSQIRSVDVMSLPCKDIDAFKFSISLLLNSLLTICRYMEVVKYVIGDPAAHIVARRDVKCRILPTIFILMATLDSGISYFGRDSTECTINVRPMWFCLSSWIAWVVIGYCDQVVCAPKRQCIETSVPLNVNFCMHRYGEWFMLMFGESIMSLLIVEGDNESIHHSLKFYSGVLSVIFSAHLHFQSEPHRNEDHALTRSRHSNYLYTMLVPVYSMALISAGICYKMFLYDYEKVSYRRMLGTTSKEDKDAHDMDGKQQSTADLFSWSIAIVLICTDSNALLHQGTEALSKKIESIPKTRLAIWIVSKYTLLFFVGTMSDFQNDPHFMAVFGLAAIVAQEVLRRSFRSWLGSSGLADDSSTNSETTAQTCTSGFSTDDNYQYEIENFSDANLALAKFERLLWIEEKSYPEDLNKSLASVSSEETIVSYSYYAC